MSEKTIPRVWISSWGGIDGADGYFRVECVYPLKAEECQDVLDLLEIIKRQLPRFVIPNHDLAEISGQSDPE